MNNIMYHIIYIMNWSKKVTLQSNSLDIPPGTFTLDYPKQIAKIIVNSAKESKRKKGTVLSSSMSMLNFYINRAGTKLTQKQKKILNDTKKEIRKLCE